LLIGNLSIADHLTFIMGRISNIFRNIFHLYSDGFRSMPEWGKKVWLIILIKLFIMFAILKFFFFSDFLCSKFDTDKLRSEYVLDQLINTQGKND
jgi:hypothetical protein